MVGNDGGGEGWWWKGRGVLTAINNFPPAHTIVYEENMEKWVPSGNGKTGRKTNRFKKKMRSKIRF